MHNVLLRKIIIAGFSFLAISLLTLTGNAYSISVDAPQFSPDGRKLLLGIRADQNSGIYNIDISDNSFSRLIATPSSASDFKPQYSPDGTKIVFCRSQKERTHLFLMSSDSKDLKQITNGDFFDLSPVFSKDGKKIYFIRSKKGSVFSDIFDIAVTRKGRDAICCISLEDLSIKEVTGYQYYFGKNMALASDGLSILSDASKTGEQSVGTPLRITYLDARTADKITDLKLTQFSPPNTTSENAAIRWLNCLPDGQVIFSGFLSLKNLNGQPMNDGFHSIFKYDSSTGEVKRLIETDAHYGEGPNISFDGKKMSFGTGSPYACDKIYIANTDGSDIKKIQIKL
jgi:Tol biopolymer transport system component